MESSRHVSFGIRGRISDLTIHDEDIFVSELQRHGVQLTPNVLASINQKTNQPRAAAISCTDVPHLLPWHDKRSPDIAVLYETFTVRQLQLLRKVKGRHS